MLLAWIAAIRADRSTKGMIQRLQSGHWTFPPPLGYRAGRDCAGAKNITHDPERGPLVRQAFEDFATGLYTAQQVLRKVTQLGLRRKNGDAVSAQTFAQTLRKPVYCGRIVVPAWDIAVQGKFEPLIGEAVFEKVQAVLDGRSAPITPRPRNDEDFPLRGFVMCGECGEPLTGSWSKGRNRYYAYYHCQDGCTRVSKDTMESQFEGFLHQLQPNTSYLRFFRQQVLDVWKEKQAGNEQVQAALSRRLQELRGNKTKLDEAHVYGGLDVDKHTEKCAPN